MCEADRTNAQSQRIWVPDDWDVCPAGANQYGATFSAFAVGTGRAFTGVTTP